MLGLCGTGPSAARASPAGSSIATEGVRALDVRPDPAVGVRATATIGVPVAPAILQAVLTDYARWPELFEVRMRLINVEWRDGRAVTDLRIRHALLPGERRLLCESRALPNGGLLTTLLGGDFKRYQRTWRLAPEGDGSRTRADFELIVEVDMVVPNWLVALSLRRELEAHFRLVREKAVERAAQGR
jgi:hypothetical protein